MGAQWSLKDNLKEWRGSQGKEASQNYDLDVLQECKMMRDLSVKN